MPIVTDKSKLAPRTQSRVSFVDMNSFFASCEQQDNYWLRNRPVAVCVYTGQFSYDLKDKFGKQKVLRAVELKDDEVMQDVIGFGSIKDLYNDERTELID